MSLAGTVHAFCRKNTKAIHWRSNPIQFIIGGSNHIRTAKIGLKMQTKMLSYHSTCQIGLYRAILISKIVCLNTHLLVISYFFSNWLY